MGQLQGRGRLILADIIESREDIAQYQPTVPGADVVIVRLRAPVSSIERRLEGRETGENLLWHRRRAAELSALMELNGIGDVLLDTEGRSVEDLSREPLSSIGWQTQA